MRLDVYLKKCRLTRRRSEGKQACENGIVAVDGQVAKAGRPVHPGQRVEIGFTDRLVEIEILSLPEGNVRKNSAEGHYRMIRDEAREPVF